MKIFTSLGIGAALFAFLWSFLTASVTGALVVMQPCSVKEDGSGTHLTIQAAVNDASCDPINVGTGTFVETVTVNRSVAIQGQGQTLTRVDGNAAGSVFTIESGGVVTLAGLTIQNGFSEGGGIRNEGNLQVTDSSIIDNYALSGGGILNYGDLTATQTIIRGNSASWAGGGIYHLGPTLQVSDSSISGNSVTDWAGGGILIGGGLVRITRITIDNNSANFGGGIFSMQSQDVHIINSTISNNHNGGLDNRYVGKMFVSHATISSNIGGGIHLGGGSVAISNTIVARNIGSGECLINAGTLDSHGYNLDSDDSCHLTATGDITHTNPLLGPLQDNGGDTFTHALLSGSPAIDHIPVGVNGCGTTVVTDQRDYLRAGGGSGLGGTGCDVGAFEFDSNQPVAGLTAFNDSPTAFGQATTLSATVVTGSNVSYTWNLGDGEVESGANVMHTYPALGTYTATVTATNSISTASVTTTVTIEQPVYLIYMPVVMKE